jgi:hypothetical protein
VLQVRVEVLQARHLPKMEMAGTCDALATVQMGYQVPPPHRLLRTPPESRADLSYWACISSSCTSPPCIGSVTRRKYMPTRLF